ncbi:MotA/TolQ/ExbB proton channel family protein [candidate division KSB1 bacterium]
MIDGSLWARGATYVGPTFPVLVSLCILALSLVLYSVLSSIIPRLTRESAVCVFRTLAIVVGGIAVATGMIGTLLGIGDALPLFEELMHGDKSNIARITGLISNSFMSTVMGLICLAIAETSHIFFSIWEYRMEE